jgi:hypothetical protein
LLVKTASGVAVLISPTAAWFWWVAESTALARVPTPPRSTFWKAISLLIGTPDSELPGPWTASSKGTVPIRVPGAKVAPPSADTNS